MPSSTAPQGEVGLTFLTTPELRGGLKKIQKASPFKIVLTGGGGRERGGKKGEQALELIFQTKKGVAFSCRPG